jgi:CRP/FNR family cyclic AMP-dependent transcriptional regulator
MEERMFKIASYETFQDGQIIFEEGSNGDWIYVVEEGKVEISKNVGGQKIVIETLKENDVFGEMSYIDKKPRSATASAKGTVVVGIIDRDFFDAEFNRLSADFQQILKTVAFRLRKITQRSVDVQKEKGN